MGPTQSLLDAEQRLADLERQIATLPQDIAMAQLNLDQANLQVMRSTQELIEAGQTLIDQGPAGLAFFENLARAAGLTNQEIVRLKENYLRLATTIAMGGAKTAAAAAVAPTAALRT